MNDTISISTDTIMAPGNGQAVHERLALAIEAAIAAGRYGVGTQLPTHRQLAQQFSVSIGSVTRAIDTLSARGLVRGEIGRGTFVLGMGRDAEGDGVIDLTINAPPPVISAQKLGVATERANMNALKLIHAGYEDHTGTARQRGVIADWLTQMRTPLRAEDVLLCNGAQQALHLAFAELRETAATIILTESASFPGAIAAATNLAMSVSPVAHDEEGFRPEALEAALAATGARIIYTTPVCQNPLGFETGPERRRVLAGIAERHDAVIVEDDIYGHYAAKGKLTYRELMPERVVFITGLSKSLTPLVRMGVMAPPPAMMSGVRRRLRAESWGLAPYAAELAVAMIETGIAAEVLETLRQEAFARQELTRSILGLGELPMPNGGPHVWLPMSALQAEQFARRASEAGVRLTPPSAAQVGAAPVGGVRLCIMSPPTRAMLERALRVLAGILASDGDVVV